MWKHIDFYKAPSEWLGSRVAFLKSRDSHSKMQSFQSKDVSIEFYFVVRVSKILFSFHCRTKISWKSGCKVEQFRGQNLSGVIVLLSGFDSKKKLWQPCWMVKRIERFHIISSSSTEQNKHRSLKCCNRMEQFSSQPSSSAIVWTWVKRILLQEHLAFTLYGYADAHKMAKNCH